MITSQLSGILRMLSLLNHALRNFANGAVIDRSKTSGNTSSFKSRFEKFVGKGP